ncbi:MAG: hypothetical protein AB7V36_14995 [Bacteroidales bacterium]
MKRCFFIMVLIAVFSCSHNNKTDGVISEIWLEPYAGLGNFSYIYVYLESDNPQLYEQVSNNEIDKIEVIGIDGFNINADTIYKTIIDTVGRKNRYVISLQTQLKVVSSILEKNEKISSDKNIEFFYEISVKNAFVHIESKDLSWDFKAPFHHPR